MTDVSIGTEFARITIEEKGGTAHLRIYLCETGQGVDLMIPGEPGHGLRCVRDALAAAVKGMEIVNIGVQS